jgi:hypothetical protein
MIKKKFNILMLGFCFLLFSIDANAKVDPPVPNGPGNPGLPIGGLIPYLIITGIAYGVYELKKKKE